MPRKPLRLTKRHFEFIADTLHEIFQGSYSNRDLADTQDDIVIERNARENIVAEFGIALSSTNPNFDPERFATWCFTGRNGDDNRL